MNVIYDSLNFLADHVHTNGGVRRPCIRTTLEDDQHRFTVQFTDGKSPRPRPVVVIEEIRRVRKLAAKAISDVEPGVSTDQFTHPIPIASIKSIHIKLHNSCQSRVRCSSRVRWSR